MSCSVLTNSRAASYLNPHTHPRIQLLSFFTIDYGHRNETLVETEAQIIAGFGGTDL